MFEAVTCDATAACSAVGNARPGVDGSPGPLAARLVGTSWSLTAVPPIGQSSQYLLQGLSCGAAADCFAVGSDIPDPSPPGVTGIETLAERWDGVSWARRRTPLLRGFSELLAIACVASSDCVAVGDSGTLGNSTLAEHWDGRAWTVMPTPNP
jgi:hypothetical protein